MFLKALSEIELSAYFAGFFELKTSKTAVKLYFEWLMSLQMNDGDV